MYRYDHLNFRRPTATNEVQKKLPSPKVTPVKSNRPVLAVITPENKSPPVYVSPFVTVSRGKDSARKEYQQRFLNTDTKQEDLEKDVAANTSPKAGAAYFRYILNDNIDRIQEMCKKWETYKVRDFMQKSSIVFFLITDRRITTRRSLRHDKRSNWSITIAYYKKI